MYLVKEKQIQFEEIIDPERSTLEWSTLEHPGAPWRTEHPGAPLTTSFNLNELALGHQETPEELRLREKILSELKLFDGATKTMDMDDDQSNLWKMRLVVREVAQVANANSNSVSVTADGGLLEKLSRIVEEHDCFWIVIKVEQLVTTANSQNHGFEFGGGILYYDGGNPPPANRVNGRFGIACGVPLNFVTNELRLFDGGSPTCSQKFKIRDISPSPQHLQGQSYTAKVTISLKSDSTKFMEFDTSDKFCFKKSLESDLLKDFHLIAENGVSVSCHMIILAAQSSVFEAMFQDNLKEMKEGKLHLKKSDGLWNPNGRSVSEAGISAFLAFIYYRGVASPGKNPRVCVELLELGHVYDIRPLERAMKIILMKKSASWFTVDAALEAHRFASKQEGKSYADLIEKVLQVLESKSTEELSNSEVCKKLFPDSDARDMYISALKPKRDK